MLHSAGAALHGADRLLGPAADLANELGDLPGFARGALRKLPNFVGDDGEAATVLTSSRTLSAA
jgi:hypothetical protein